MIEEIAFKVADEMTHERLLENYNENLPTISTLYLLEMMFTELTYLSNRKMQ